MRLSLLLQGSKGSGIERGQGSLWVLGSTLGPPRPKDGNMRLV